MRFVIDVRDRRGLQHQAADLFCETHARQFLKRTYPFAKWPEPWQHEEGTWNESHTEIVKVRAVKDDPGVTKKVACIWCQDDSEQADEKESLTYA